MRFLGYSHSHLASRLKTCRRRASLVRHATAPRKVSSPWAPLESWFTFGTVTGTSLHFICMLTVVHAPSRRAGRLRLPLPFSALAARRLARQVTVTVPRGIPEQDTLSRVGHYPFCRLRKHSLRAKLLSFTRELLLVGTRWDSSLGDPLSSWTPTVAFHASWRPCAATPRRARTAAGS